MNDPTATPDPDEAIRRALQAETEGVQASDELLDRTMAAARRPAVPPYRRLLAAASVAAIAIGAGVVLTHDHEQKVDSSNVPTSSSTTTPSDPSKALATLFPCQPGDVVRLSVLVDANEPIERVVDPLNADERTLTVTTATANDVAAAGGGDATAASATFSSSDDELAVRGTIADLPGVTVLSTTDCRGAPANSSRPTVVALVREDGWLVVVDLETGDQRELYFGGDPEAPPAGAEEGGPQFIDAVDLSPAGGWVYFSTCCEPASGTTFRIAIDGGEPEQVAVGAYPRVSPDGHFVATSAGDLVVVTPVDGGRAATTPQLECCFSRFSWSPDGSQLAGITGVGEVDEVTQAILFDWDGVSLTSADTGKPDNPGSFVSWTNEGILTVTSGSPVDDDLGLSQDFSYTWLLWVDQDGVLLEQAGHEASQRAPIDGLPKARAADW